MAVKPKTLEMMTSGKTVRGKAIACESCENEAFNVVVLNGQLLPVLICDSCGQVVAAAEREIDKRIGMRTIYPKQSDFPLMGDDEATDQPEKVV